MKSGKVWVKLRKVCSCFLFLVILCCSFVKVTYLFRETGTDRVHIMGIKEEHMLDMVYIGGSNVTVFWQPMKAWNDCGFTSYNYATNSFQAEMTEYYVREMLKTQKPKVVVIGLRSFQFWSEDNFSEDGLRNGSDSMDIFSINRLGMVKKYLDSRSQRESVFPYYFDILKYHSNYTQVLGNRINWVYTNNTITNASKGWEWSASTSKMLETPQNFQTSERAELDAGCIGILEDLLEICKEENLQVLFVVSPYSIVKEDQMKYNTMKDIIEENGFQFLNANEYYDEMGIDFTKDFHNANHVNCFGAEKYTKFLEEYLIDTYHLPDHRGEAQYVDWDQEYARFAEQETKIKINIEEMISDAQNNTDL